MDVKLLDVLDKKGYEPNITRPEGFGITAYEYMESKHCSEDSARNMLEKARKDGVLDMHQMKIGGKKNSMSVYHRPEDWPPK